MLPPVYVASAQSPYDGHGREHEAGGRGLVALKGPVRTLYPCHAEGASRSGKRRRSIREVLGLWLQGKATRDRRAVFVRRCDDPLARAARRATRARPQWW